MSEPLLTYLMPAYAAAAWISIILDYDNDGRYLLPTSVFGVSWAIYNTCRLKIFDAGSLCMGIIAIPAGLEMVYGNSTRLRNIETFGCAFASFNFSLPLLLWSQVSRACRRTRTIFWLSVFQKYCFVMTIFYAYAGIKNYDRFVQ